MKQIDITPKKLQGTLAIPPSKSVSHRAIMCAALAPGTSRITNVLLSDDITATSDAMAQLGAQITYEKEPSGRYTLIIRGTERIQARGITVDCIESGSTLRFLIPLMALDAEDARVIGRGRLAERPMQPYYDMFEEQAITYVKEAEGLELPLRFTGTLKPGSFRLDGSISSQFITGLLFALPLLDGDSEIIITTTLESRPYVDITLDVLQNFGIQVENHDYERFVIAGNQHYQARDYRVEGDYSQGAFWLVAGILGGGFYCKDLKKDACQGDKAIIDIIRRMKGTVIEREDGYEARPSKTEGAVIDVSQCPDLVPVLAVLAGASRGTTEIINAGRLRYKESDRLKAMRDVLEVLGVEVEEHPEGLTITGRPEFGHGVVDSCNDHRIAMASAVASFCCDGTLSIKGAESVRKSYPDFWEDFQAMGGVIHELNLGK